MQNPAAERTPRRIGDPIPRPRPNGPADLTILADDLDRLAEVAADTESTPYSTAADHAPAVTTEDPSHTDAPIFVDASGQRRKLARRLSIAAVAVAAGYGALLATSFAGGPIPPNALLPVPGVPGAKATTPADQQKAQASASQAAAAHDGTTSGTHGGLPTGSRTYDPKHPAPGGLTPSSTPQLPLPTGTATLPSTPQPTGSATSSASPSATSSTTRKGNPTPPGHSHTR